MHSISVFSVAYMYVRVSDILAQCDFFFFDARIAQGKKTTFFEADKNLTKF